jgi:hypothetical protein
LNRRGEKQVNISGLYFIAQWYAEKCLENGLHRDYGDDGVNEKHGISANKACVNQNAVEQPSDFNREYEDEGPEQPHHESDRRKRNHLHGKKDWAPRSRAQVVPKAAKLPVRDDADAYGQGVFLPRSVSM